MKIRVKSRSIVSRIMCNHPGIREVNLLTMLTYFLLSPARECWILILISCMYAQGSFSREGTTEYIHVRIAYFDKTECSEHTNNRQLRYALRTWENIPHLPTSPYFPDVLNLSYNSGFPEM